MSVRRLAADGVAILPSDAELFLSSVRAHSQPYLAILVHKRAKAYANTETSGRPDTRWSDELNRYADFWPHLAANANERAQLIDALDRIVAEEQRRLQSQSGAMPMTSRFDTSWAI
jgi:hypothetical protein